MTMVSRSYRQRKRAEQIAGMGLRLALNQTRYKNAQEAARQRAARASAKRAALEPLLVEAGYGPHGAADWILAEARALRARQGAARSDGCTGRDCQVCAEGRRMDAARASRPAADSLSEPYSGREVYR